MLLFFLLESFKLYSYFHVIDCYTYDAILSDRWGNFNRLYGSALGAVQSIRTGRRESIATEQGYNFNKRYRKPKYGTKSKLPKTVQLDINFCLPY